MLIFCLLLLTGLSVGGEAHAAATAMPAVIAEVQAALDKGDAAQAQRLADGALGAAGGGERAQLLLYRGLARELLGSHDAALADFTTAIDSRSLPRDDRAQALLQRGFLLDGLGRLDLAAKDYGAVVALKTPLAATALNNRGNIFRRQNRMTEARRDYLASLDGGNAKPQYPYFGLGQIAETQGDKNAARDFYAKAVAADPSYRLASERLEELGGPPEGRLADPADTIHLHPPQAQAVAAPATLKPLPASDRIVLKPPRPTPERIVLKPPRRAPSRLVPQPVGLRPALDSAVAGGPEVQLGAWRSQAEAEVGWQRASSRAGGALDGLRPHIVRADLPGRGTYYRLRVATPAPESLCGKLRAAGLDCLRARD